MSSSPYNPTASYYKFVLIGNLLSTFILQFSYGATHLRQAVIDESLIEVADSVYAVKRPHSIQDLFDQIKWVRELTELEELVKRQHNTIENRYNSDDPNIEDKLRSADPDCIRSRPLDFQTENFIVSYPIDLLVTNFNESGHKKEKLQAIASTHETLQMDALIKLFLTEDHSGNIREPICQDFVPGDKKNDEEIEKLPNVVESELSNLKDEGDFEKLASYLTDRFEEVKTHGFALYYSSFYWRLKGNSANALKCLHRYIDYSPESDPAKFQLGTLYLRLGLFNKAIKYLEDMKIRVDQCGQCNVALGDAYVLDGNFPAAIEVYQNAYDIDQELEIAAKKAALLRCNLRIFEVMEHQHNNLLETISGVELFKERMKRLKQLESKISANRAPPETRLQSKLAHEYYSFGQNPYVNCRDGTQWIGGREKKRLFCTVGSLEKYNESLMQRKKQFDDKRDSADANVVRRHWNSNSSKQNSEYVEKLKGGLSNPFPLDPSFPEKYPLPQSAPSQSLYSKFTPSWPSIDDDCRSIHFAHEMGNSSFLNDAISVFISPMNKGYNVMDLLGKYLVLRPGELTPLPWKLPNCEQNLASRDLPERFRFLFESKLIRHAKIGQTRGIADFPKHILKTALLSMIYTEDGQNSPPIAEVGQRIFNLIEYNIGPRWISLNLAALFFRFLGATKEALTCVEEALKVNKFNDISLVQFSQILLMLKGYDLTLIERALSLAISEAPQEPVPYYLLGVTYSLENKMIMAEKHYDQSLRLNPEFEPPINALLVTKCRNKIKFSPMTKTPHPICCWPNKHDIYCFNTNLKLGNSTRCFALESAKEYPHQIQLIYFRCNTPYSGKSYLAPAYAQLISSLLQPAESFMSFQDQPFQSAPLSPVLPLDYGGYSKERINAHVQPIWPEDIDSFHQYEWESSQDEHNSPKQACLRSSQTKQRIRSKNLPHKSGATRQKPAAASDQTNYQNPNMEPSVLIEQLRERSGVMKFDISFPENPPKPSSKLVEKGQQHSFLSEVEHLKFCRSNGNWQKMLEKPVFTYVSVTTKGIKIADILVSHVVADEGFAEPVCSEIENQSASNDAFLKELDNLPAYRFVNHLKFYHPEKALQDTLLSLYGHEGEKIEQIFARLSASLKISQKNQPQAASMWALTTVASVAWRVKGNPVNAVQCLRHSLVNAPNQFKDVPLINLANIYYQAGFLNSALVMAGKALEISPDSVVAIHFTLANIYASMGEFVRAIEFYHSTLALQSNFQAAKERIWAIRCIDPRFRN